MDFFGYIYGLFKKLYCENFDYFLWGYNPETEAYSNTNLYSLLIGISALVVALVCLGYYIIDKVDWNKRWHWLIANLISAIISFVLVFLSVPSTESGEIPDSLLYASDGTQIITTSDYIGLGIANFIIAMILFVIFSWIMTNSSISKNCKNVPF